MMCRTTRTVALLVVLALVAAGCVRSERSLGVQVDALDEGATCLTPLEERDPAAGPVTLELWHALNAEAKTTLEDLAAQFNAEQDEVEVEVLSQGTTYGEVRQAYIQGIAGGSLPGLVHMDINDLQVLIDTDTLRPGGECYEAQGIEPDVLPSVQSGLSSEGTYWPTLATVSTNVLYYNKAHFARAGLDPEDPPETIDEVLEASRAIQSEAGIATPLSLLLSPGFIEYWVGGAGETLVNNANGRDGLATEATLDNPATVEVLEWLSTMADEGLVSPFNTGGIDQYLAVASQQASMLIETSTASTTIATLLGGGEVDTGGVATPEVDLSAEDIVVAAAPFPGVEEAGQAQIGGGAFYMPASSPPEVQAAAWAFSRYMATEAGQVQWHTQGSYLPVVEGATADPAFTEFWDSGLAGGLLRVATEQLLEVGSDQPSPLVGPREDYGAILEAALGQVAREGADPEATAAEADAALTAALERYAEDNADAPTGGG